MKEDKLKELQGQSIFYSEDFFNEETLNAIINPSLTETPIEEKIKEEVETEKSIEEIYASIWKELEEEDSEIKELVQKGEIDITEQEELFKKTLDSAVNEEIEEENDRELKYKYELVEDDMYYIHTFNDEVILKVPVAHELALSINKQTKFIIACTATILDVVVIVCSVIGLRVAIKKKTRKLVQHSFMSNMRFLSKLKKLDDKASAISNFITLLSILRDFSGFKKIFKQIIKGKSWKERIVALANFLSFLALLGVSGGASIAYKIAALGASMVIFAEDLRKTLKAYKEWKK